MKCETMVYNSFMVEKMKTLLITDEKDPKWTLLGKILGIVSSRRVKQEMAKRGISPVNLAGTIFKIVLIAIFFSVDISYVISELLKRAELRRFAKLAEIPEAKDIYRFLARFNEKKFIGLVLGVLGSIRVKRGRNRVLIVDSTDVSLDLNWFRKKITKADLEGKEFKWGYS